MNVVGPTRRERRKIENREEILSAALEMFSKHGYYNTSMQEIAQQAEFAVGTLYTFFKSKEELYRALVLEHIHQYERTILGAIERESNEIDVLGHFIRAKAEAFGGDLRLLRLYLKLSTSGEDINRVTGVESEIRGLYQSIISGLGNVFERGIEKEIFRATDPHLLAIALNTLANSLIFEWLDDPEGHPLEPGIDQIKSIVLDAVFVGEHRTPEGSGESP